MKKLLHILDVITNPWNNLNFVEIRFRKFLAMPAICFWNQIIIINLAEWFELKVDFVTAFHFIMNFSFIPVYQFMLFTYFILHWIFITWVWTVMYREVFISRK